MLLGVIEAFILGLGVLFQDLTDLDLVGQHLLQHYKLSFSKQLVPHVREDILHLFQVLDTQLLNDRSLLSHCRELL